MGTTRSDPATAAYREERARLLARPGAPGAGRRSALAALTDRWLAEVFADAGAGGAFALVAVGGYGRCELSPGSDLDLLLLHEGVPEVGAVADAIWYPVWDSGVHLDHAVRRVPEARALASADLRVLLGLLDARLVAGEPALLAGLRSAVLDDWRRCARTRLPELRESARERERRAGAVAFTLEPELKEGAGGLRDVSCLRAVAASWVTDRSHGGVDAAASRLLDVRDALHLVTRRAGDRLLLQEQDAVAARLGLADGDSVLRVVAESARSVDFAAEITWRRVEGVLRPARRGLRRSRPAPRRPLGGGLLEHDGEVVLAPAAQLRTDPLLPLRAGATAAQLGLPLAPTSVALLLQCPPLPDPWPAEARTLLVQLLGAGDSTVRVWEALDQGGVITSLLPEWEPVRNRPQRNALHRWTVDRHLVETAAHAALRARRVERPDLLLVAALLHDIGKGRRRGNHSVEGARIVTALGARLGFPPEDVALLVRLVRHHLLLADTATRRDLADPATVRTVTAAVGSPECLQLLHALTEADAAATGPAAWSEWRAALVDELVTRAAAQLQGHEPLQPRRSPTPQACVLRRVARSGRLEVTTEQAESLWAVTVVAPDRRGLLAAVAGILALQRLSVRSADVRTVEVPPDEPDEPLDQASDPASDRAPERVAVQSWLVEAQHGDAPVPERLREEIARVVSGVLDAAALLARREVARSSRQRTALAPPRVEVVPGGSDSSSVLEVRAHDRPGLLHALARTLSGCGVDVQAARVATLGAEVVDVFYVTRGDGHALSEPHGREVARALRDAAS